MPSLKFEPHTVDELREVIEELRANAALLDCVTLAMEESGQDVLKIPGSTSLKIGRRGMTVFCRAAVDTIANFCEMTGRPFACPGVSESGATKPESRQKSAKTRKK